MGRIKPRLTPVGIAIHHTTMKLRKELDALLEAEQIPHLYSLGFTNGVIFCEHQINHRPGRPRFYNQEMTIGSLPKPTHFETEGEIEARRLLMALYYQVIEMIDRDEHLPESVKSAAREAEKHFDHMGDMEAGAPKPMDEQPVDMGAPLLSVAPSYEHPDDRHEHHDHPEDEFDVGAPV